MRQAIPFQSSQSFQSQIPSSSVLPAIAPPAAHTPLAERVGGGRAGQTRRVSRRASEGPKGVTRLEDRARVQRIILRSLSRAVALRRGGANQASRPLATPRGTNKAASVAGDKYRGTAIGLSTSRPTREMLCVTDRSRMVEIRRSRSSIYESRAGPQGSRRRITMRPQFSMPLNPALWNYPRSDWDNLPYDATANN